MLGIIFSLIAGICISVQSVFNTRLSDKIGLLETTVVVHVVGLIFAFVATLIWGSGNFKGIYHINKLYLFGGLFGVIIVYSVMKGVSLLGPTFAISILLISQVIAATIIDTFGLFESEQIKFHFTKPLGILVMIGGIIIFKLKG